MNQADDANASARYYANPAEQKILIAGLQRYFALPERSQNRNRIAKEVSQYLRFFSPHWSHRAVRLWFNNNRHTYFEGDGESAIARPPDPPATQASPLPPRIPLPQIAPSSTSPDAHPLPMALPPIQLPTPKVQFPEKCPPFPQLAPSPQFQALNPISFWNRPTSAEPTLDQRYISASNILAEIRRTPERDAKYGKLIQDFDSECHKLLSRFGGIQAERVDPTGRFCPAPTRREPSQLDFPLLDPLPESISSGDILDFSIRSLSFGQHLYSADSGRGYTEAGQVWQTRRATDRSVASFESAALTASLAAMTYVQFGGAQRTMTFSRYADRRGVWVVQQLPIRAAVESMAADANFAYLLTSDQLFRASLSREGVCENVPIAPTASGRTVVAYGDGAIAGFHSSPQLLYVRASLAVHAVAIPYQGVMCLAPIDKHVLCGVLGSGVVRLIAMDGREVRAFVGHAAPVVHVTKLSESAFASSGDDATVRVWDVRNRAPVVSVATGGVPVMSVSGSTDYLVAALQSRAINVFDLRNATGRPVLAVATDDYEPAYLQYNQRDDLVAMFGVIGKETARDSVMFLDGDGQNRQRIFRMYSGFLGDIAQ